MPPPQKRPSNEERAAGGGVDRISDLPDGVLHHVLSLLQAHEAVRTCVLARRWRHLWRSAPALLVTGVKGFQSAYKFTSYVDALLLEGAAPLERCDFCLSGFYFDFDGFLSACDPHMSHWIICALRRRLKVLRFSVGEFKNGPLRLPVRPLSSQYLTTLELHGVECNDWVLDFSGCPALVDLKMWSCGRNVWKLSSPSLKRLSMLGCLFNVNPRARMSLPSLVSLELIEPAGRAPLLGSMPLLETAVVRLGFYSEDQCQWAPNDDRGDHRCERCYYDGSDDGSVHLKGLSTAAHLNLSAQPQMLVFKRDLKWRPTFSKLKTLALGNWFVAADLFALIWFLQHSPILEKLTLELSEAYGTSMGTEETHNLLKQSVASDNLKIVEIKCQEVNQMVLKILKILNAFRIPLEKINIQCDGCFDFVCKGIRSK